MIDTFTNFQIGSELSVRLLFIGVSFLGIKMLLENNDKDQIYG